MDKHNLLRAFICETVQEYQVAFLRNLADKLENDAGGISDEMDKKWSDFVGIIADDIDYVTAIDGPWREAEVNTDSAEVMGTEPVNLDEHGELLPKQQEGNND